MKYRTNKPYDRDRQSESRADQAEYALSVATDRNGEAEPREAFTDVSDLLANVRAFCDRAGLDYGEVDRHAYRAYLGDGEDGPRAERDAKRFPSREA